MIPQHLIERKRDGAELGPDELRAFFEAYLDGRVQEYQMAAFLMAVVFRGLSRPELAALVSVMLESGAVLDLSALGGARVDKHSTGGVGDKVSLALAPLAAELGLFVPMMSGRGLGHTGGTLDKLEAIPGFRTDLGLDEFRRVLALVGCAMIGQTAEIAPLDRRIYDLRSVTGTVPCLPLIAASIMSKKLAEGLDALVLDVKVGAGAFLPEEEQALALARTMVVLGGDHGVRTRALLTAMDRPLGRAVGNGVETAEALACLAGGGPADLRALVLELAAEMALAGGVVESREDGRSRAAAALDGGGALRRMERLVEAQGGDSRVVADPGRLAVAPVRATVTAGAAGTVTAIDPLALGRSVVALGGGRTRLGQEIDARVGFVLGVAPGDEVRAATVLAEVHAADEAGAREGRRAVLEAVRIVDTGPEAELRPLISHRVDRDGAVEVVGRLVSEG
jgi:pyrimidine-nucleoside phosphorylase